MSGQGSVEDDVRDSYNEENLIHMSDIEPQLQKSQEGSSSTVKVNTESLKELEPYGRDRLELNDYLDSQFNLTIWNELKATQEMCHTPEVVSEERPTKYMYVSACMKNENKEHYKRKIKLILIDHFPDQGIPYDRQCDE